MRGISVGIRSVKLLASRLAFLHYCIFSTGIVVGMTRLELAELFINSSRKARGIRSAKHGKR